MRYALLVCALVAVMTSGCIAVTARDNKFEVGRKREAVAIGDRIFLVNTKSGRVTELRVPAPGEGSSTPAMPLDDADDDESSGHDRKTTPAPASNQPE